MTAWKLMALMLKSTRSFIVSDITAITMCIYVSCEPDLLVCLSLPPWVRYLPGFAVLLGTQPGPKNRHHQTYLKYVADQFQALGEGIYTYDAHEKKEVRLVCS